jgi:hypothetical protein
MRNPEETQEGRKILLVSTYSFLALVWNEEQPEL